jgi:hypothetical protein
MNPSKSIQAPDFAGDSWNAPCTARCSFRGRRELQSPRDGQSMPSGGPVKAAANRDGLKMLSGLSITADRDGDLYPNHSGDRDRRGACGRGHVRDLHGQK